MDDKDIEKIINNIMAEAVLKAITDSPTNTAETSTPAEKTVAWIEVYDDVLDEAYDMSQEYREYE